MLIIRVPLRDRTRTRRKRQMQPEPTSLRSGRPRPDCDRLRRMTLKLTALLVAIATAACSTAAAAADLPSPKPNARDLYVSCFLLAHETDVLKQSNGKSDLFGSSYCSLASISMIVNREGKENPKKYKFCLDRSASVAANIPKAMAFAYLDFFEGPALKDKGVDGSSAYLFAMIARWPCPD